ncbi:MerR family transcriptional regulator [Paenibacillus sp. B-A-8]|uniref:MerR family transcriptional regulator n=1 Tax=Paenibacillus sp. B-A-8 TaxID=3400419 RepID=UPI003B01E4EB
MNNYYSIGETAKLADTTIETLRHYDRIHLLKPAKVDPSSGYRYYSDKELIYLDVINFCKKKNMPLHKIKDVFTNDNLDYIINFLKTKDEEIEQEIKQLNKTKSQLSALRKQYENQAYLSDVPLSPTHFSTKALGERAIVKIHSLQKPSLESFHQLQDALNQQLEDAPKDTFVFDLRANIMTTTSEPSENSSVFFVVCEKYPEQADWISILPKGIYLYGYCSEEQRMETIQNIAAHAKAEYNTEIPFVIQSVIFTGMFQWVYEIQVLLTSA